MWVFQLGPLCCKCQKTQPYLALGLLARVPGECRGESGFRAGLPVGTQRISFGTWFLSVSQFYVFCGNSIFRLAYCMWPQNGGHTFGQLPWRCQSRKREAPTNDVTISLWPRLDMCPWLNKWLRYRNAVFLPIPCHISHLWKELSFQKKTRVLYQKKEWWIVGGQRITNADHNMDHILYFSP